MAGCKTWRGKLTWSFPFERVATLGERREKESVWGGACMKDHKKTKVQCSLWSRKRTITSHGHKRIHVTETEVDNGISAIRSA